jgi:hypothetical protein
MKKWAYYNECDPFSAQWIRNLMAAGMIMMGEVDERSIEDVHPADVASFIRCHWFAGIATWDYALAPCRMGRRQTRLDRFLPMSKFLGSRQTKRH